MRPIIQEVGVVTESVASSGATPVPIERHDFTVAQSASSDVLNLIYQFPTNFDEDDLSEGLYQPRFFVENMPKLEDVTIVYKQDPTVTEHGTTALTGTTAMPTVIQENTNYTKATYFDATNKNLKYLLIQMAAGADAPLYNTELKDRSDPNLVMDFERQATPQLDYDNPNANSDHLWDFSQVDLYVDWPVKIAGTTYTHRHLIGWCSDENFTANLGEELVEFLKGKPMARAVRFISQLSDMVSGTISTMDPWFFKEGLHLFTTVQNRQINMQQRNTQRPISNYSFTLEWQSNSGHQKRLIFPKGQLFVTGEMTPGGSDIASVAFELTPIVTANKVTYNMKCTQSQVQRTILPFGFNVTA